MIFPQQSSKLRESELRFVESLRKEVATNSEKLLEEKTGNTYRKGCRSDDIFQGVQLDPRSWEEQLKRDCGFSMEKSHVELTTPVNVK